MYKLIILEDADREFQEVVKWYEDKSTGLGLRFFEVIKRKLEIIQQHPERNTRKKVNFREAIVKSFLILSFMLFIKKRE